MNAHKNNKKVSVYLRNHEEGPSCYYRIVQYINQIDDIDFKINDALPLCLFRRNMDTRSGLLKKIIQLYLFVIINIRRIKQICFDIIRKPEIIIIQREIFPRIMPFIVKGIYKKVLSESFVIWDFDDSILQCGEIERKEWDLLCRHSNIIIATSDYLLDAINYKAKKIKMSTTDGFCDQLDLSSIYQKRKSSFKACVKLVWVGTHSNLNNVVKILPWLNDAGLTLKSHNKKLELEIVCNIDSPEFYANYDGLKIQFTKWTRISAQKAILNAHIGLMPIPDNEFSKGKGGFKLVQYIASGIPVIGSDVGFNKKIISDDIGVLVKRECDWTSSVIKYGLCFNYWKRAARSAHYRYLNSFSFEANLRTWKNLLHNKSVPVL